MAKGRMGSVADAGKEGKQRSAGRYYWVDNDKLERFGIVGWTPKGGSNFISVIPPVDDEIFYAREVYVHFKVGGDKGPTHLCVKETRDIKTRKKWNKPCAVCEKRKVLASRDATRESAEELKPSRRFLFYIVDTSELPEDATEKEMASSGKKVQWYDGSTTFRDRITGASENKRSGGWIDVSDPEVGKTIVFDRIGKGLNTKYENFSLESRDPIPDKWLEVPDYDDVLLIPNYDDVAAEVDLIGSGDEDDQPEGRTRSRRGEQTVGDDEPSGDDEPRRGRTRKPPKDEEPAEKEEKNRTRKPPKDEKPAEKEEKKEEKSKERESSGEDDEVEAIRKRLRDKKKAKEAKE